MSRNPVTLLMAREQQARAIAELCRTYNAIRDEPLTAADQADTAHLLTHTLRQVEPARCRALVVLAVQDADPAQMAEGHDARENLHHVCALSGNAHLVEELLMEAMAGVIQASEPNEEGIIQPRSGKAAAQDIGATTSDVVLPAEY